MKRFSKIQLEHDLGMNFDAIVEDCENSSMWWEKLSYWWKKMNPECRKAFLRYLHEYDKTKILIKALNYIKF